MGFIDELKKLSKPYAEDDDFDDDDFDEDEPAPRSRQSRRSAQRPTPTYDFEELGLSSGGGSGGSTGSSGMRSSTASAGGKVVNIAATSQLQVIIVTPDRFDSVSEIAERLREKHAILLNLEQTNKDVARRLVDFLSGCAFALDGKIKKVAISTYLITPYNVDIVGDLMDELENNGMYL